jgi:prepilin-type N-terminal cleavage/methylation domain-containing protein
MKNKGFTIIELIVVIAVISVLMILASNLLITVLFGSNQQFLAMTNVDQAVTVSTKFTNDLRNATNGVDGSFPLYLADVNQIIFYSNAGVIGTTSNRIRYYLSGTTLYRGVVTPTGTPLTYNLSSEVIKPVQTDVVSGTNPIFTYFNGDYVGTGSALVQPVNINNIKYTKMTLVILKKTTADSSSTFSVSAGGVIRNLKTNLGN